MKALLKSLVIPVATYSVLRGGEALVSVIAKRVRKGSEK